MFLPGSCPDPRQQLAPAQPGAWRGRFDRGWFSSSAPVASTWLASLPRVVRGLRPGGGRCPKRLSSSGQRSRRQRLRGCLPVRAFRVGSREGPWGSAMNTNDTRTVDDVNHQVRRTCSATTKKGTPCTAWAVGNGDLCAGHSPAFNEARKQGMEASAAARRERVEARKLTALDWAARKLEENGEELASLVLDAARRGDWRAAAFLYERVHGKPRESVRVEHDDDTDLRQLTDGELRELKRRVMGTLEAVPPGVPPAREVA